MNISQPTTNPELQFFFGQDSFKSGYSQSYNETPRNEVQTTTFTTDDQQYEVEVVNYVDTGVAETTPVPDNDAAMYEDIIAGADDDDYEELVTPVLYDVPRTATHTLNGEPAPEPAPESAYDNQAALNVGSYSDTMAYSYVEGSTIHFV